MVNMDEWRAIDYESRLEKELKTLEKSNISENNKKLILRYKNWRIANGVSVARVHRELVSLRLLCQKFGIELEEVDEEKLLKFLRK